MSEKETLLKDAQEGYLELQQSIAGLDEARAGEPWLGTWGVRERSWATRQAGSSR